MLQRLANHIDHIGLLQIHPTLYQNTVIQRLATVLPLHVDPCLGRVGREEECGIGGVVCLGVHTAGQIGVAGYCHIRMIERIVHEAVMELRHILIQFELGTPERQSMAKRPVDGLTVNDDIILLRIGIAKHFVSLAVSDMAIIRDRTERKYQSCIHTVISGIIESVFCRHAAGIGQIVADLPIVRFGELTNIKGQ